MKVEGCSYTDIAVALGSTTGQIVNFLSVKTGKEVKGTLICARCKLPRKLLHNHHDNYETDQIRKLCPSCHTKTHHEWIAKHTKITDANRRQSRRRLKILNSMAAKLKAARKQRYVVHGPLNLTAIELAQKGVLEEEYKKAKGNISVTAREIKWSRTKTLEKLKAWKLYDLFKHKPGPRNQQPA